MDDQFVPNQNGGINAKQLSDTKDLQSIIIDLMKTNQPNLGLYNGTSVSDNNSVPQQKNYENDSYYQTVIDIYEYLEHIAKIYAPKEFIDNYFMVNWSLLYKHWLRLNVSMRFDPT